MKSNNLLIVLKVTAIFCVLFACYNYYKDVLNPRFSHDLKCEGIVLNKNISYHITDKNSITELKKIRGNEVKINEGDVILHYRDKDMEKITPSYWGTVFYDKEWKFRLDQSFTDDAGKLENIILPFLRLSDEQEFVKPTQILTEKELSKNHFFNTNSGYKNTTRFYLQLKDINGKQVLSWFDDGIKQKYRLNTEKADTIGIFFNQTNHVRANKNFEFDNSTTEHGSFYLIYNPDSENRFSLLNTTDNSLKTINSKNFQVGDMMFSINHKFSIFQKIFLTSYLLILIGSIIFFFLLKNNDYLLSKPLNNVRISLLCFYLLGTPILSMAFDIINFEGFREFILAVGIPLIPLASHYVPILYKKKKIDVFINKIFNNKYVAKILVGVFIFFVVGSLLFAKQDNERVLGIPILHFIKFILLLTFFLIYSDKFGKIISNFSYIQKRPKLKIFTKSFVLFLVTFLCSLLTQDFGVLSLIFWTIIMLEHINGNLEKIHFFGRNLKLPALIIIYIFSSFTILLLCSFWDDAPRKLYRITYSWFNPANEFFYSNVLQGDRETISFLFHNLKLIFDNPFGIENLSIPVGKSTAHTDLAIHNSLMKNGVVFIFLLLLSFFNFTVNTMIYMNCIYRELFVTKEYRKSLIKTPVQIKAFTTFLLLFTAVQLLIPVFSNLALYAAPFTGISFTGISTSIGDGVFLLFLLFLMDSIVKSETNDLSRYEKTSLFDESIKASQKFSTWLIILILMFMAVKAVFIQFQDNETYIKTIPIQTDLDAVPLPESKTALLKVAMDYFRGKNISKLNDKDKFSLKNLQIKYFRGNNAKLGQHGNFSLAKQEEAKKISLDSLNTFSSTKISGSKWKFEPVFAKDVVVNGKREKYITNKYFTNIDFKNTNLDKDGTAIINKIIEKHITEELKNFRNLTTSVLITDNKTGNVIINSAYPFISKNPEVETNFYPGSIKKVLLAHYFSIYYRDRVNGKIFKSKKATTPILWIGTSDNAFSYYVFKNYVDIEKFKKFLEKKHKMPFFSTIGLNGYAEKNWKQEISFENTIIGGRTKYNPIIINGWFRAIANDVFGGNNKALFEMLNAPFYVHKGTATEVAFALRKEDLNYKNFICKTGTLAESSINKSTAFVISNNIYTISVLIDGIQPENDNGKSAKFLFIKLIPEIKEYLK